jgi:hypothetical protein
MTDDKIKDGSEQQGVPRAMDQYDFSDLKDAHPSNVAFAYLDKGWRIVPVERQTGEVLVITDDIDEETGYYPLIPTWTEDPGIEIGIVTGQRSGVVALRCKRRLLQRTNMLRVLLTRNEHVETLENDGIHGLCVLFKAPKDGLPSLALGREVEFLGEGDHFVPSQSSWNTRYTELAPMPDWLISQVTGTATPTPSLSLTERVATGDFAALNKVTAFEAAQEYMALGWKLAPAWVAGKCQIDPNEFFPAELWRDEPTKSLGFWTGVVSGVVGIVFENYIPLDALEATYGQLPYPRISGKRPVVCFRAPQERFPFKELTKGTWYIGEDCVLPAPPSIVEENKLMWEKRNEATPDLPEIPSWLHDILSGKQEIVAAAQPQPKAAKKAPKKGGAEKGKGLGPTTVVPPRTPSPLETAALHRASQGLLVFPIKPNDVKPLIPKEGCHQATRDPITISQWWKKNPKANIGVQTGTSSDLVVLAVDARSGLRTLAELETQHGQIETRRVQTPSGGLHLYFHAPAGEVGSSVGFRSGLDFCGNGDFVIVPPSRVGGQDYQWVAPPAKVAEMPDWLLKLVTEQALKSEGSPTAGSTVVASSAEWQQEQFGKWLAEHCERGDGLSVLSSDLLEDFSTSLGEVVDRSRFGELLRGKGFRSHSRDSDWWYDGLRLKKKR